MAYRLVHVEWEDANRDSEWTDVEQISADPSIVTTVGFLVKEGPRAITIALTDGLNQVCCQMTIPRGGILKISDLQLAAPPTVGLQDHE